MPLAGGRFPGEEGSVAGNLVYVSAVFRATEALLKDEDSVQSAVIKVACKKAMAKARDYAEGVGAGVGRVLLVNANGGGISYNIPRFRTKGVRHLVANAMMDGAAIPDETAVADSVEVEASVSIVVELK